MAPFSMRCNTCGEYIYKGKKFNARKETVEGEDYFGIKIFRFYIKWCVDFSLLTDSQLTPLRSTLCSAEITFKTDPKNTDYAAEHGASRNFEPWREEKAEEEEDRLAKLEEEENNPMKQLENRQQDAKREMEILDALQDIRARNARIERAGQAVDLLARLEVPEDELDDEEVKKLDEEDERLVQQVFSKLPASGESSAGPSLTLKRKANATDVEPDVKDLLSESAKAILAVKPAGPTTKKPKTNSLGIKVVKKKK